MLKIQEESQQRLADLSTISKETEQKLDAVKKTFINRLNIAEKQIQNNQIRLDQVDSNHTSTINRGGLTHDPNEQRDF